MTMQHLNPPAPAAEVPRRRGVSGVRADWARLVVATLARVVIATAIGGLFWASAPAVLGWKPTTVMSDSMAPRFFAGDVVVAMPVPETADVVGRVLLVDDPDHTGRLRLHRAVGIDGTGALVTRGDANPADDSSHVIRSSVHGVAVLRIPLVGLPVLWARTGDVAGLAALILGGIGLVALATADRDLRRERAERIRPRIRRRRWGVAIGGAATAGVVALVVSTGAHAAYSAPTGTPTSSWGAASDFACWSTATAPDSPYFFYRLNETSGGATDVSGNGRTGTLQAGATRTAGICPPSSSTAASPAVSFNGSATGQIVPAASAAIAGPSTFSIETWFSTTSTTGGKLVGFGNSQTATSGSYDRHVYLSPTGQVVFGVYPNQVKVITSAAGYNDGAWHHAVATLNPGVLGFGGGMKLYVDGALVAQDTSVTTAQSYTGYWRIGYDNVSGWGTTTPTSNGFTGRMDNVAVYTSVLSASQVSSHYATGH